MRRLPLIVLVSSFVGIAAVRSAVGDTQKPDFGAGDVKKGYDINKSGLVPVYPEGFACSPITSSYASWVDVDGLHRDEIHSGIDAGRLGEWIIAPGPGTVRAAWEADWQWGAEGALLVVHTAEELNLPNGPPLFYSVYDHLKWDEVRRFKPGQTIRRGERLARVYRPGGHKEYLPEVHFEVWEAHHDNLTWVTNKHGGREWRNDTARLIDPLYMFGIHSPPADGTSVSIVPYEPKRRYKSFAGFTYLLECERTKSR